MDELWQVIEDYPIYAISNGGQVLRIDDYAYHDDDMNEVYKIRKPFLNTAGKLLMHVCFQNNHDNLDIAFEVCERFVSPRPNPKARVLWKDGNKSNCHYSNLYWGTYAEYAKMFNIKVGRPKGTGKKRMGMELANEIRQAYQEGMKQSDIATKFNVSQSNVSLIVQNKIWSL